jgi:DNA repair protein RadC
MARGEFREFSGLRGMAKSQALRLAAFNALHRRLLTESRGEMLRIVTAQDFHARYAPELRDMLTETVVLVMLNQQNHVIRDAWFSQDSPNGISLKVGDFLRPALREYAPRVAIVHNHPANSTKPSIEDSNFTRNVRDACGLLGLVLVDHVIVAESGYFSFKENGMLGG